MKTGTSTPIAFFSGTLQIAMFFLFCSFSIFLFSCHSNNKAKATTEAGDTQVEFLQPVFDFGKIAEGEVVAHSFYFKNTGDHSFIIKNIETGCGCTTTDYSKEPVAPGKEGKIEITFNSSGREGKQYKEIRIFANVPEKVLSLTFTAEVKN